MTADQFSVGLVGGTGEEGRGLALRWAMAGARVTIGSRNVDRAHSVASHLNRLLEQDLIKAAENREVVSSSTFVLLTVPFEHAAATLQLYRDDFQKDSVLLDITVPVVFEGGRAYYRELPEGSASEHLRQLLPNGVTVVAAFKTEPAHLLQDLHATLDCDTFVACDSKEVRQRVMTAIRLIKGLRPVDAGPLANAQTLERLTVFLIGLNRRYKVRTGRFRVLGLETELHP